MDSQESAEKTVAIYSVFRHCGIRGNYTWTMDLWNFCSKCVALVDSLEQHYKKDETVSKFVRFTLVPGPVCGPLQQSEGDPELTVEVCIGNRWVNARFGINPWYRPDQAVEDARQQAIAWINHVKPVLGDLKE